MLAAALGGGLIGLIIILFIIWVVVSLVRRG
jgi:hypothetical protein